MKLKTRLYITILAVVTFPGVRELAVWLADRIFNTNWAPFYRLWINFAGGFVVVALLVDTLWAVWDWYEMAYRQKTNNPRYTFKKD